jgi:hypothetical protein
MLAPGMALDWSRKEWGIAVGLAALAAMLVLKPAWLAGLSGGDQQAQGVLRAASIAQSLAFSAKSPPEYVTCAGDACAQQLRVELPAGLYVWMEAADGEYTGRALHAASDTVWVWGSGDRAAHAQPATAAERAARNAFLTSAKATAPAQGISQLAAELGDPDMRTRLRAAEQLRRRGPAAAAAVPALIDNLGLGRGANQAINIAATNALLAIGPRAALPPLIKALQDPDPEIAGGAAFTIAGFGPAAKPAMPALLEALRRPDRRDAVAGALELIEKFS